MVRFNELRITNDGRYLIIDISVRSQPYYNNVYLDSISIDTQDTYKDGGPSSSIVYFKDISGNGNVKNYRIELGVGDFLPSLSDNMFFIYIKARGVPAANTPCGMDGEYTLGVTLNICPLYNAMMSYVRETNSKCNIPKNFIDMFLKFKALEVSVNTEHYAQAIEYYNKFIKNVNQLDTSVSINRCSCNG